MISAKRLQSPNSNKQIDHLRKRFEDWRKSGRPRTRIPKRLWESAVQAAGQYGLNRTAKTLRLDYYNLKKRLDATSAVRETTPAFIELSPVTTGATQECVIELENRNGAKMRIHIKGMGLPDLTVLSSTFWRGRP
jgi:hypothetical protein